uniref:Uncharacterized protein n=1 Tax=Molossus molossus TaxID=27622 RepID=A0A7J8J7R7_MOLMO|nr:hypothetical protein HJG59_009599 [Molossus molossus]
MQILTTGSILHCDWNATRICITLVSYDVSRDWQEIKAIFLGQKNTAKAIQLLEGQISETFSRHLPELTWKVFQGVAQRLSQLNPLGQTKALLTSILSNATLLIIILLFAFLVFRGWHKRRIETERHGEVMAVLQYVQSQKDEITKKGEMKEF